ncbi:MAG: RNA methyltransferase [Pseudomonadota bacterium]
MQTRFTRSTRQRLITVFGRNAVRETLEDLKLDVRALHLATSNRESSDIERLRKLAEQRSIPIFDHARDDLARISRNKKQDQGVALDVYCPKMAPLEAFLNERKKDDDAPSCVIGLDGVSNPQNYGMIIRSAVAAGVDGILCTRKGNPALGPLVLKASAGTAFRAPLLRCESPHQAARQMVDCGYALYRMSANAPTDLYSNTFSPAQRSLFILGGETAGISGKLTALPGENVAIPMSNSIESLNVAVSASLLCFELRRRRGR